MKKIILKLAIIPVLTLAVFITLQSFRHQQQTSNRLDSPQWFTLNNGGTETDPEDYTPAPGYDPGNNGCEGTYNMCAVLALPDTENEDIPQLNIDGGKVEEGGPVSQVARTETP
jgi:hypothetical protein